MSFSGENRWVRRVPKGRFLPLCGRTLLHALLRVPPLICVFGAVSGFGDIPVPGFVWAALAVVLHVLFVLPSRYFYREGVARELGFREAASPGHPAYGTFLRYGLWRYARGLLWGIPFLLAVGLFLYSMEALPYNEQGLLFEALARFFGFPQGSGLVGRGVMIYFALTALLGALFFWGWRRDWTADQMPLRGKSAAQVFARAKEIRLAHRDGLRKMTLRQFLLSLPAFVLSLTVLVPYAMENVRASGNITAVVRSVKKLLAQCPPVRVIVPLSLILLFIALPLCVLRRVNGVRAVRTWASEETEGGHAAG